jgi:hypothetical protein
MVCRRLTVKPLRLVGPLRPRDDQQNRRAPDRAGNVDEDHRAINVPLPPVLGGTQRSPAVTRNGRSEAIKPRFTHIPKLIVGVRFPSPAPKRRPRSETNPPAWALIVPGRCLPLVPVLSPRGTPPS